MWRQNLLLDFTAGLNFTFETNLKLIYTPMNQGQSVTKGLAPQAETDTPFSEQCCYGELHITEHQIFLFQVL